MVHHICDLGLCVGNIGYTELRSTAEMACQTKMHVLTAYKPINVMFLWTYKNKIIIV